MGVLSPRIFYFGLKFKAAEVIFQLLSDQGEELCMYLWILGIA